MIFGALINFQGMGHRMTKMNITFSMENGVLNMVVKFFSLKKPILAE